MVRARLGMLAVIAAGACGQVQRDPSGATTVSGAGSSSAGSSSAGSSSAGSSSAGMGGSFQLQAAISECQTYCETLDYRLPTALCEDWNRPEWHPQFCDLGSTTPSTPCADYCRQVYQALTPACAARLQPVVRCVAPTYASLSLPPPGACWLGDCRPQLFSMTSACYGLQERLAAARATWQASGIVDYQLSYDRSGGVKAQVLVRTGREPAVTPADAFAWTVPKLFDEVERALQEPGVAPRVSYDANLGYVMSLAREQGCAGASAQVTGIEIASFR